MLASAEKPLNKMIAVVVSTFNCRDWQTNNVAKQLSDILQEVISWLLGSLKTYIRQSLDFSQSFVHNQILLHCASLNEKSTSRNRPDPLLICT